MTRRIQVAVSALKNLSDVACQIREDILNDLSDDDCDHERHPPKLMR